MAQSELVKFLMKKSTPPGEKKPDDGSQSEESPENNNRRKQPPSSSLIQTVNFVTNCIPTGKIGKKTFNTSQSAAATSMIKERRDYLPNQQSMIQARCNYLPSAVRQSVFRQVADFFQKSSKSPQEISAFNDTKNCKNLLSANKMNPRPRRQTPEEDEDLKNEEKEKNEKEKDIVTDYLIQTVPGLNSFEFFELPTPDSHTVEIIQIKNGVEVPQSGSEPSTSSTSNAPQQRPPPVVKQIIQIQKTPPVASKNGVVATTSSGSPIILNNLRVTPAKRSVIQQRVPAPITAIANSSVCTAIASTSAQGMAVSTGHGGGHLLRILNSPSGMRFWTLCFYFQRFLTSNLKKTTYPSQS